jgi:hypothetical protein
MPLADGGRASADAAGPDATPNSVPTGGACTSSSVCVSAGADALCLDEATYGFPHGYCTEQCNLMINDCATPGALCEDVGLGTGYGLCFVGCDATVNPPQSTCRSGYVCYDFSPMMTGATCVGDCTADAQCASNRCDVASGACTQGEICNNGVDDDGDGLVDCADPDCAGAPACPPPMCGDGVVTFPETCDPPDGVSCGPSCTLLNEIGRCTNGVDDDNDGLVDCADPDCASDPACAIPTEICQNGLVDDDFNGFADCADPACMGTTTCTPGAGAVGTICTNHSDCAAASGSPACITDLNGLAYPGGYCSEFCVLARPACAAGASCKDLGIGNGFGLCLDDCGGASGGCRTGYTCKRVGNGGKVCSP